MTNITSGVISGSMWGGTGTSTLYLDGTNGATLTVVNSNVVEASTPSGTQIMMKTGRKQIHPRLYFKFVKSKIKEVSLPAIESRLFKVQKLLKNFEEMGQEAPFESLMVELFKLTKHAEAIGSGYNKVVEKSDIDRFMGMVNAENRIVKYGEFTNFPRPVPKKNQKKILEAKKTGVFDNFMILYLDYANETHKTTKQKIIEKDPIVFGTYKEDPSKHFFITDWVDEICDLTLLQFVDKMKKEDKTYDLVSEDKVDEAFLARIKEEYQTKKKRLEDAVGKTYKELAKDEEIDRLKKELAMKKEPVVEAPPAPPVKKSIWSKLFRK